MEDAIGFNYKVQSQSPVVLQGELKFIQENEKVFEINLSLKLGDEIVFPRKSDLLLEFLEGEIEFFDFSHKNLVGLSFNNSKIVSIAFGGIDKEEKICSINFAQIELEYSIESNLVSNSSYGHFYLTENITPNIFGLYYDNIELNSKYDFTQKTSTHYYQNLEYRFGIDQFLETKGNIYFRLIPYLEIVSGLKNPIVENFKIVECILSALSFKTNSYIDFHNSVVSYENTFIKRFKIYSDLEDFKLPTLKLFDDEFPFQFLNNLDFEAIESDQKIFKHLIYSLLLGQTLSPHSKFMLYFSNIEHFKTVFGGDEKLMFNSKLKEEKILKNIREKLRELGEYFDGEEQKTFLENGNIASKAKNVLYYPMVGQLKSFLGKLEIDIPLNELKQILEIRNDLIHGRKIIDEKLLMEANRKLFQLNIILFRKNYSL